MTTPLLADEVVYGSIEGGEYGLRKRTPKSNRPSAALNKAKSARSQGIGLPPKQMARQTGGRGKAVLSSLWALQSVHGHVQASAGAKRDADIGDRPPPHDHKHSFVYTLLNPHSNQLYARIFKHFIAAVILVDLTLYIVSTDERYSVEGQKHQFFHRTEAITSSIFLVEYLLRLATCTESRRFKKYGPILGRVRYMFTMPALIDAFATFPFFLELMFGVDLPTLTFLRAFRLLRILKTTTFSRALGAVNRVVFYNREILWVAFILCIFLVLVTAFLMYYLRPRDYAGEDAADFSSIGATMYLSTLMLTGQGGPSGDLPWYTKSVVLLTGVFSIGMFAIPASMLTWGFEAEAERLAARAIQKARKKQRGADGDDSSTTSSSSSAYSGGWGSSSLDTSDEEYQRVIAGDEEEEDELMAMFNSADADHSGSLTKSEFIRVMGEAIKSHASGGFGVSDDGGEVSGELVRRIETLERKVDSTNKKLDRLLEVLDKKK